jgi:hypothetical protein
MRFILIILSTLFLAGCATTPAYNPMQSAGQQEILLNESSFKSIQDGMSMDQVHEIMGQELVVGYGAKSPGYNPLTIPNPYKSQTIKDTGYIVEYYIESIRQPDGVVSDNELMPLVFKNGKLVGRGWPLANSLSPSRSPA